MKQLFEFELPNENNFILPKDIVQFQCDKLSEMSSGLVLGKIKEYDGPINDYTRSGSLDALRDIFDEKEVRIQSDLGELSGSSFTYEFYITSKNTTNFIYRVFFLRYGISPYPLQIVLDESIAIEIKKDSNNVCFDEADFYEILREILNSSKIKTIVRNLFLINRKEEASRKT